MLYHGKNKRAAAILSIAVAFAILMSALPADAAFFNRFSSGPTYNPTPQPQPQPQQPPNGGVFNPPQQGGGYFGGGSYGSSYSYFRPSQPQTVPINVEPTPNPYTGPELNLKIVAYGDSIVRGVGTTQGNDFVSRLSRRTGIPIMNAGVNGATTQYALANVDSIVIAQDPDIVILFIGGNDILQGLPANAMFSNIRQIILRIQQSGASVILLGIHHGVTNTYESAYRQIATETGAYYVPYILDDIIGRVPLMADLIHPNDQGHRMIADRVEPTLRAAISARVGSGGNQNTGMTSVACAANPTTSIPGQPVTWTAFTNAQGGQVAYEWIGTDNLSGTGQSVSATYLTGGTKTATVRATSGTVSRTATCSMTVQSSVPPVQSCQYYNPFGRSFFGFFQRVGNRVFCQ